MNPISILQTFLGPGMFRHTINISILAIICWIVLKQFPEYSFGLFMNEFLSEVISKFKNFQDNDGLDMHSLHLLLFHQMLLQKY